MEPDVYVILFEILIWNDKYVVCYDICYILLPLQDALNSFEDHSTY